MIYSTSNTAWMCLSGFHTFHINTVVSHSGNQMWYRNYMDICDILRTSESACQTFIFHILSSIVGCSLDMWWQVFYSVRMFGLFCVFSSWSSFTMQIRWTVCPYNMLIKCACVLGKRCGSMVMNKDFKHIWHLVKMQFSHHKSEAFPLTAE